MENKTGASSEAFRSRFMSHNVLGEERTRPHIIPELRPYGAIQIRLLLLFCLNLGRSSRGGRQKLILQIVTLTIIIIFYYY